MKRQTRAEREAAVRRTAAAMLGAFYRPRHTRAGRDSLDVLSDAASAAAQVVADALNSGRLADARRWARAYALLDASHQRLINRRVRDRDRREANV